MASKGNIAARVTEVITPVVNGLGYDIWDVEYVKEGADWHLRVTIDSPGGINIDDCEKVHRAIDPVLDEFDPIEDAQYLDVSSPGLERDIRTAEHYLACVGETVEVKLFSAHEGMKSFIGKLMGYEAEKDLVTVELPGGREVTVTRKQVSRCNIYFDFDNDNIMEDTEKDHE